MTRVLADTSVLLKWFHETGEEQVQEAHALRAAHLRHDIRVHVIDLALYEVGNVLTRRLRWNADDVADQLDDLVEVVGPPLALDQAMLRRAAGLAERHSLSFYDASWAAGAVALGLALVTLDSALLAAGLGETPQQCAQRLRLPMT